MLETTIEKKKETIRPAYSYFALKSENEIYYQMASIFKEAANNDDNLAEKIFSGILAENQSKVFLENSF